MTLLVSILMVGIHAYIGWRLSRILRMFKIQSGVNIVPFLFLLSFYLLPFSGLIYFLFWGDPDLLTFSQPVSYWFWFGLVFSAQLFTWLILIDIAKWLLHYATEWDHNRVDQWYRWIAAGVFIFLFVFTATKMFYDTTTIQVKRHTYTSERVPPGLDGFRLVHITDIQGDEYTGQPEIARYIQRVNQLQADIVMFTGDLISYGTDYIPMAALELGKAEATYGTYAVIGDHDYWAGVSNIIENYQISDINLLQDENSIISIDGDSLLLTGITEVYSKHIPGDSLKLLMNAYQKNPLKILVTHQATNKVIDQAKAADYPLLLAGHTHGGQLRVPFMFKKFSAAEEDTPYLSGTFTFGDLLMNVDNGLGFTLAPVRYNAPPTISVIDLKSTQ